MTFAQIKELDIDRIVEVTEHVYIIETYLHRDTVMEFERVFGDDRF